MKVSIILPSCNRYPLNLYTLYALENQNFDLSKMEVILIDDASTDKTPLLKDYKAPFPYKYVRNEQNQSLATTRNQGGKIAKGEVLIFLDAEMLVSRDFVKNNYERHVEKDNIVVVGGTERERIYTYLFKEFDRKQVKRISKLVNNNSIVRERVESIIGGKVNDQEQLSYLLSQKVCPVPIVFKEDIQTMSKLKSFTLQLKNYNKLLTYLGDDFDNSPITWMTSIGSNISLKKKLFEKVNGYEEMFKGWGPEDAEFAYRLKKAGATFVIDHRLKIYHQEHPITISKQTDDKKNWVIFQEKHPDLDICIRAINLISNQDYYPFIDRVLREKIALNNECPGKYKKFEQSLISMLKQIRILDLENKPIKHLIETAGINSKNKKTVFEERNEIASLKNYPTLITLFDLLVNA